MGTAPPRYARFDHVSILGGRWMIVDIDDSDADPVADPDEAYVGPRILDYKLAPANPAAAAYVAELGVTYIWAAEDKIDPENPT